MTDNPFLTCSDSQLESLADTYNIAKFTGKTPLHLFKDNGTYDLIMRALIARYVTVHGLPTLAVWSESLMVTNTHPHWNRVIEELVNDFESLVHMSEYTVALRIRDSFLPYQISDSTIELMLKAINEAI